MQAVAQFLKSEGFLHVAAVQRLRAELFLYRIARHRGQDQHRNVGSCTAAPWPAELAPAQTTQELRASLSPRHILEMYILDQPVLCVVAFRLDHEIEKDKIETLPGELIEQTLVGRQLHNPAEIVLYVLLEVMHALVIIFNQQYPGWL